MTINLKTQLVDFKGRPLETDELVCPTCRRPIAPTKTILQDVLTNALGSQLPNEVVSGADKLKRYRLGMRIGVLDEIELTAEEIVVCKGQVEKFYPALIYGQVCDLLEPKSG